MSDQECNSGKKYGQKGTLCGPNRYVFGIISIQKSIFHMNNLLWEIYRIYSNPIPSHPVKRFSKMFLHSPMQNKPMKFYLKGEVWDKIL